MRNTLFTALLLSLACLFCAGLTHAQTISPQGYGVVRFGDKLSLAQARMRQMATPSKTQRNAACDYVKFNKYPGILFMVESGVVTRAESRTRWINNSARVRPGEALEAVQQRHPGIVVTPHKYDEQGHYLTLSSPDGEKALVFEESRGKVNSVRAGLQPSVAYVEGCL
jgi:hypothetical protein